MRYIQKDWSINKRLKFGLIGGALWIILPILFLFAFLAAL